jgi:hypothetical protein
MQIITIVRDPSDSTANQESVRWAVHFLTEMLENKELTVTAEDKLNELLTGIQLIVAGPESTQAAQLIRRAGISLPSASEAFVLARENTSEQTIVLVCGKDARGLVYGVLELADRIRCSSDPLQELYGVQTTVEKPANEIRCVSRLFVSEEEDKAWYYDKTFWNEYLTELALHRFNRFSLTLGMGYDLGHEADVVDNYFTFTYAFLFAVPGYEVTVSNLSDQERDRNLEMLRYIGDQAHLRGIGFHLGLWSHSSYLRKSPNQRYRVEGLTEETHAPYVRDALRTLIQSCSAIDGLTLRVHYESGIPEPAHAFWKEVMPGITQGGRKVEIDLHAKGIDDEMIQIALDTGMPVIVSPKYWGEQMAVPYHQLSIREKEMNVLPDSKSQTAMMAVTATSRRFTRYGYADFLKEDREYGIMYRIWPATQRVLLWGDPLYASGYGRSGQFSGSQGMELWEPLSFIGKKGTGVLGGRELYGDVSLQLNGYEWRKYVYTYRLWGRLLYNPDADPESWRRYLRSEFGGAALDCEQALAKASRILPFITVAHAPTPGHNEYWPEMYANVPIVNPGVIRTEDTGYDYDTFGLTSSLDPELFYQVDEYAEDLLKGNVDYKFTPIDSASRLKGWADGAERHLEAAASQIDDPQSPVFRRLAIDVRAQIGLGRFFARKFQAALAYAMYERIKDKKQLEEALQYYHSAKEAWKQVMTATAVYRKELPFGNRPYIAGHWDDRLKAIEEDINAMERLLDQANGSDSSQQESSASIYPASEAKSLPSYEHIQPKPFTKGSDLELTIAFPEVQNDDWQISIRYRHANQAELYQAEEMTRRGDHYYATIPGTYTDSLYPIVYFFIVEDPSRQSWMVPGFNENLSNQPYYILRETT